MGRELLDGNLDPMGIGNYSNSVTGDIGNLLTTLYRVHELSDEGTEGRALDHQDNKYELRMPKSLPNTDIPPKGFLHTTSLFPIGSNPKAARKLKGHERDIQLKLSLLER